MKGQRVEGCWVDISTRLQDIFFTCYEFLDVDRILWGQETIDKDLSVGRVCVRGF